MMQQQREKGHAVGSRRPARGVVLLASLTPLVFVAQFAFGRLVPPVWSVEWSLLWAVIVVACFWIGYHVAEWLYLRRVGPRGRM